MSTNSGIAVKAGETYQTIYCHWDGHPKTMLPKLRNHYNSWELAVKLISQGDASSIGEKLEPTGEHTFTEPEDGVCVFYYRDRGDDWLSCASTCYTKKELFKQSAFEYVYIFEDGQWNVYNMNGKRLEDGDYIK